MPLNRRCFPIFITRMVSTRLLGRRKHRDGFSLEMMTDPGWESASRISNTSRPLTLVAVVRPPQGGHRCEVPVGFSGSASPDVVLPAVAEGGLCWGGVSDPSRYC